MKLRLNWLFGITSIPFERIELPFVFGNEPPFTVKVKDKNKQITEFKVGFSLFGKNREEKLIIKSHFKPEYELEQIPSTISLEITFSENIEGENFNHSLVEDALKDCMPNIKKVVEKFYDAYRKLIFTKQINSEGTIENIAATLKRNLPLSFRELRNLLLYKASFRKKVIRGVISEGEGASFSNLQKSEIEAFKSYLKKGQPLPESWLFSAFVSYYEERYDETVISSAIVLESALSQWIKKRLENKQVTRSEIEKFLNNASKRDVLLILFKTLKGKVEKDQTAEINEVFNLRNSLVHGKGKCKGRDKARKALITSLNFLESLGYFGH